MTPKSPNSIRKFIVTNPEMPLRVRIKALREMNSSVRFLHLLLKDTSLPDKLRALVLRLLAERSDTTLTKHKAKAKVPSVVPSPKAETEAPGEALHQESNSGPIHIDPKLWDILGGFNDPRYVRGPEPVLENS